MSKKAGFDPVSQKTLVIMVKEPRPGRVKTRLARDIGATRAAQWYRHQALGLVARLRDPRWRIVLAVSPDAAGMRSRIWAAGLPRRAQGRGGLGRRMVRALTENAAQGPVCLIGSDIPGVHRHHIARAFTQLGSHDAVFGPAEDGGFWLIGLSPVRPPPRSLFTGVRWSGPHALADSLATLPGRRIALADTLADVDTADDLARAVGAAAR